MEREGVDILLPGISFLAESLCRGILRFHYILSSDGRQRLPRDFSREIPALYFCFDNDMMAEEYFEKEWSFWRGLTKNSCAT